MPLKKQLTINFERSRQRKSFVLNTGKTNISLKLQGVQKLRTRGIFHEIRHFKEHRIVGDVPLLKRHIWEQKPSTKYGQRLQRFGKVAYRTGQVGAVPGKAVFDTGLVVENVGNFAGKLALRHAMFAMQDKLRGDSNSDINRVAGKGGTLLEGGVMLIAENRFMNRERKKLIETLPASKAQIQNLKLKSFKIHSSHDVKQLKYAKKINRLNHKAFRATHLSYAGTTLGKFTGGTTKKAVSRFVGKPVGRTTGKLVGTGTFVTVLSLKRVGISVGRATIDKFREVASENDSLATINAGVKGVQYATGTYRRPFYNNVRKRRLQKAQRKVSKLQRKSTIASHKLKKSSSKLQGKKRKRQNRLKNRSTMKGTFARIMGILKNPLDVKNFAMVAAKKVFAMVILPTLPIVLVVIVGFMVVLIALSPAGEMFSLLGTTAPFISPVQAGLEELFSEERILDNELEPDSELPDGGTVIQVEYSEAIFAMGNGEIQNVNTEYMTFLLRTESVYNSNRTAQYVYVIAYMNVQLLYNLSDGDKVQTAEQIATIYDVNEPLRIIIYNETLSIFVDPLTLIRTNAILGNPIVNWQNYVTSEFGYRTDPFTGEERFHSGIDIARPTGTDIMAVESGVVLVASYNEGGYGNFIVIDHGDDIRTLYAHNYENLVEEGDRVNRGQVIATVGSTGRSTGAHLHFEVILWGYVVNPRMFLQ
ncbi:MAG: M23 family metallopeptidase [Oscillospiraceae bacterium]|nr:M23 family metallopeptidase [Oscillospiraceae bacterium]